MTKTTFERIRGSTFDLISPDEFRRYAEEGLVASGRESMDEVRSKAEKFLRHVCNRRCKKRVVTQSGGTVLKCRVANNGIENPSPTEHTLKRIDINHSPAACGVLEKLGLVVRDAVTGTFEPVDDTMLAVKHYLPAHASEGPVSACNGR